MRHRKSKNQLNRFTSWHKATIISLVKNTLIQQSIKTTLHRAKAAKPLLDKVIYLTKSNTLAAKRRAFQILGDHKLVSLLFSEIGPRFVNRQNGFSRIINLGMRRGDSASLVIFELTEIKKKEVKKPKKEKEAKPKEEEPLSTKAVGEKPAEEKKAEKEKPPISKKPTKKFFGGFKGIFKKERDSL